MSRASFLLHLDLQLFGNDPEPPADLEAEVYAEVVKLRKELAIRKDGSFKDEDIDAVQSWIAAAETEEEITEALRQFKLEMRLDQPKGSDPSPGNGRRYLPLNSDPAEVGRSAYKRVKQYRGFRGR